MGSKAGAVYSGVLIALLMVLSSLGVTNISFGAAGDGRTVYNEATDNDATNNDDFTTAQEIVSMSPGDYVAGTTGLGDTHRIDYYVIKNVPSGRVINASCHIMNWNSQDRQSMLMSGWNKYHIDNLAWSNREDNPDRREWEAVSFLCVVTGDYYIGVKPIAGSGTFSYWLNVRVFDPTDITSSIGSGGVFGPAIPGKVSSLKWYPGQWYKLKLTGESGNMNDYLYVNVTEPGGPTERLQGDPYFRNLEPESFSYWLNHSWWLDSFVQYEDMHAAACYPGERWYYLDMQGYNTTGRRAEDFEIRMSKTVIDSDGDNHPKVATPVTYELGKTTVRKTGSVIRGPDMFDWYKVFLAKGEGVSANLTLNEKSVAIFRLSIYRDNLTATTPEKGYDLMSSWTNKPGDQVLNRVNALATNVTQEGYYYIGVIAQIGLVPNNVTNLADWTVQTAWAKYSLDITLPDRTLPPIIQNPPAQIVMAEGTNDTSLKLNFTGSNSGVFYDPDFAKEWGDALTFSSSGAQDFQVSIANFSEDPESTVTLRPNKGWNGEANITFTATDLYGKANSTVVHVRVTQVNDPPFLKNRIPDFQVKEGDTNNTMKDIDLFQVFGDPDFPPFGDDNLTFTVDNSTYPAAAIVDAKLTFGQAPSFPGKENHIVVVTITAADKAGMKASQVVNVTVINLNRPPEYNETRNLIEIQEDEVSYFDLYQLFFDPDGDPMNFAYLGGASDNLTVEIAPNGSAILRPAKDYYTAQEILRFKAIDPLGANRSGELMVRIRNVNDPPYILPGGMVPDPLEDTRINEGDAITFRIAAADIDNKTSDLRYTWFIDDVEKTKLGTAAYTWRTTFDDAGQHAIKARISDGLSYIDADWNITVNDTNRAPVINEAWPQNNTEVGYGASVKFCATAVDPDGDPVTFYWRLSDGTLLKTQSGVKTSSFSKVLSGGKQHIVVLEVQDGKGGVARMYIYVKVDAKTGGGGFIPGFETLTLGLTILVAGMAIALMRRRN